ncbi:MAG: insulinase family protein [Chlamydiae bacterium]|nr:MAG: insulinase family protein [Chlamydiota bacterium]
MSKFPFKETKLDNNLKIVTAEMPFMESVAVGILVGIGGRHEQDEELGISHFLEHACFKGTKKRNARQISQAIEGMGGSINGFTSEEVTCYYAKVRYPKFEKAFDVLADMYLNAVFNCSEMNRERGVIKEEIKMYMDMPGQLVYDDFSATIWKNHPLGRSVLGTFESVDRIKSKDLVNFRKNNYTPNNTVISVAGNISHNDVLKCVKKHLAKWDSKGPVPKFIPVKSNQKKPRVNIRNQSTEQAHLVAGFRSVGRLHPDRFSLRVLSNILGGNMSSRLNHEIREKRGLAYSVHSHLSRFTDVGSLIISLDTNVKTLSDALSLVLKNCVNIAEKGIKKTELKHAKEYLNGIMALTMEHTTEFMIWLGRNSLTESDFLTIEQLIEKTNDVTADDVQRIARKVFKNNRLNIALIADNIDNKEIIDIARLK